MLLHCVQAHSPAVAALYGASQRGVSTDDALLVLPAADPNNSFRKALLVL